MGNFRDRARAVPTSGIGPDSPALASLREECPELVDALAPRHGAENGDGEPFTCSIFVQDARIRFCLAQRESGVAAFGDIEDPSLGFHAIEKAIREDRLGWKKDRKKK